MAIKFTFSKTPKAKSEIAYVPVYEGKILSAAAKDMDKVSKGVLKNAITKAPNFDGKAGQICSIALPKDAPFDRIIALGFGDLKKQDKNAFEELGGNLVSALKSTGVSQPSIFIDEEKKSALSAADIAAAIATGVKLRSYAYTTYKQPEKKETLKQVDFILDKAAAASKLFARQDAAIEGVYWARDLMNEPANTLYPDSYARKIAKTLKPLGVDVEILGDKQMKKMGFHAHLEVGKGSQYKPRVVIMRWHGKPVTKATKTFTKTPFGLVGKGITFDTGGYSLKSGSGMTDWSMKMDMGGSAAVVGAMKTLALRKSKAQVVGIVALAENMIDSNAYKPTDIIQSMGGKTIEVLNTDAEGRLVLIDSLTYIQKTYKPKAIIDLATLTGAMVSALGFEYCGVFANNDDLWGKLSTSSQITGEKLWRMPLDSAYKKEVEAKFSDLKNIGGPYGGACTAAAFLEHFIEDGQAWAHMDIAGKMLQKGDTALTPMGGVGFGVRVLDQLIESNYE